MSTFICWPQRGGIGWGANGGAGWMTVRAALRRARYARRTGDQETADRIASAIKRGWRRGR